MGGMSRNYQNQVLDEALQEKSAISIFLAKGLRFEGRVKMHDTYTILIQTTEKMVLIYKHAVTTVFPARIPRHVPVKTADDNSSAG